VEANTTSYWAAMCVRNIAASRKQRSSREPRRAALEPPLANMRSTACRGAYETSKLLVQEAAKQGYGEYRAHLDFMDLAADQYSFGDQAYRRFTETIKDAVDPNGILAPGEQSIWPTSMRGVARGLTAARSRRAWHGSYNGPRP
jgi:hypothetical protein